MPNQRNFLLTGNLSGWPSGLRRQTQGLPCSPIESYNENSGPLMRAWVRIPLLTELFATFPFLHYKDGVVKQLELSMLTGARFKSSFKNVFSK